MSQFNSIRNRGNYANAGRAAADNALRTFIAQRRSSPDYTKLTQKGAELRYAQKKQLIEIKAELAKRAIDVKSELAANKLIQDGKTAINKELKMAGKIAAAGKKAGYGLFKMSQKPPEKQDSSKAINLLKTQEEQTRAREQEIRDGIPTFSTGINENNTGGKQGVNSSGKVELASSGSNNSTAMKLMTDLTSDGYTPVQAAAIVGNAQYESADFTAHEEYAPNRYGTKGAGFFQWTNAGGSKRRDSFEGFANNLGLDPTSYEANTGYMLHELKGGAGNHWTGGMSDSGFRKINDLGTAVTTFQDTYLRPAKATANTQQRMKNAEDILNQWTSLNS